jgi:hypothetical protein
MTLRERRESYDWTKSITPEMCVNCRYFHQHYMLVNPLLHRTSFVELPCGHCTYNRIRYKKVYDFCEHFESRYQRPEQRGADDGRR